MGASLSGYNLCFAFFRLLSLEQTELMGGVALANLEAPFLLTNAAWYPRTGELASVAGWYTERELKAALVVPAKRDEGLERALQEGPFRLEQRFSWRAVAAAEADDAVVEQAGWSQTRVIGGFLAGRYDLPAYGVAVGASLARAMQEDKHVEAFVTYKDEVSGVMVTLEHEGTLAAMIVEGAKRPLLSRLKHEAANRNLSPYWLEPRSEAAMLELWNIR